MREATNLNLAYHMGYEDALVCNPPDASQAMALVGECHDIGDRGDFRCSACLVEWQGAENHDFLFCPSCGAKVVDE